MDSNQSTQKCEAGINPDSLQSESSLETQRYLFIYRWSEWSECGAVFLSAVQCQKICLCIDSAKAELEICSHFLYSDNRYFDEHHQPSSVAVDNS